MVGAPSDDKYIKSGLLCVAELINKSGLVLGRMVWHVMHHWKADMNRANFTDRAEATVPLLRCVMDIASQEPQMGDCVSVRIRDTTPVVRFYVEDLQSQVVVMNSAVGRTGAWYPQADGPDGKPVLPTQGLPLSIQVTHVYCMHPGYLSHAANLVRQASHTHHYIPCAGASGGSTPSSMLVCSQ